MKALFVSLAILFCFTSNAQIANTSTLYFGDGTPITQGISLIPTSDNGFLLFGTKGVGNNGALPITDQWMIKLNQDQEVEWEYAVDYSSFVLDYFFDGTEVSDGYIMLGGFYDQSLFELMSNVEKLDLDGNLIWSFQLDDSIFDANKYCTILSLENDGFIIGGYTDGIAGSYFSLSEYNANGELAWFESYPDLGSSNVGIFSYGDLKQTADGDFLLAGEFREELFL